MNSRSIGVNTLLSHVIMRLNPLFPLSSVEVRMVNWERGSILLELFAGKAEALC